MGYARVRSIGLVGLEGHAVTVEAYVAPGLPSVTLSGLPDASLNEARDRVRAAVVNAGQEWPNRRITVNLLPADLPKRGPGFDLAIAVVILAAAGRFTLRALGGAALIGELGLDGQVRPVRGVLPMAAAAARAEIRRLVVPIDNAAEARLVPHVEVRGVASLAQLIEFLVAGVTLPKPATAADAEPEDAGPDLSDVVGQERGRFALEIAAAGRHHLALLGPPGAGKTLLAQRLPSILPPLSDQAALEVTALHSIAGLLPAAPRLIRRPPFQAPHHTATAAALVGGGSNGVVRPGAISLAHHGVLFIDEAPEMKPHVLNSLRQPLEEGFVIIARAQGSTKFPARVQLVLAANPCPCGVGDQVACTCPPVVRRRYLGRLAGPLLDRIDLQVTLAPVTPAALAGPIDPPESSASVLQRVIAARAAAAARWSGQAFEVNAEAPGSLLRSPPFRLPGRVTAALTRDLERGTLSARGFDRVLRVAWTIADLAGRTVPTKSDVDEAVQLRLGGVP